MPKESDPLNTPAMKQYLEIKSRHPDSILFFRMGDFYEMFLDDAIIASSILDIALTKRQNQIPMCGIPYHATESYISRLLSAGRKIVICEQIKNEDPTVKLLQREVVRVVTPGTVVEENLLSGFQNNYLCVIFFKSIDILICFADLSTSELYYYSLNRTDANKIRSTVAKYSPKEVVLLASDQTDWNLYFPRTGYLLTVLPDTNAKIPSKLADKFESLKLLLLHYVNQNYKDNRFEFKTPVIIEESGFLELDEETVRNLELIENRSESSHTLFFVLNKCLTAKGKRILKNRILFPSRSEKVIRETWLKIRKFDIQKKFRIDVRNVLNETADLERILSRFKGGKAYPRDFRAIQNCILTGFLLEKRLQEIDFGFSVPLPELTRLKEYIESRISDGELPVILGNGDFLKSGFSARLDKAREAKNKGRDWILELEEKEKKSTGLGTLKIRYNKVVGYYLELSRAQAESVPKNYFKKQTLVTTERFTFPELEEIERSILEADSVIQEIEKEEFENMLRTVLGYFESLLFLSTEIGELDYILNLHFCKEEYDWTCPEINQEGNLFLTDSRHPVVEKFLPIGDKFISNSMELDREDSAIAVITGPNMAGKSTFMRQVALSQILFQMGSYIPAKSGNLSIADQVFTRIGSADNLTTGESTFYVEMRETAQILQNRTEDSLIIFDEVGRGTSTYDGLSLAWAILEYLNRPLGSSKKTKTLFATHYHELTELEKENGIFNLYMDTFEKEGEVIFLKKVKKGRAKKSFGIYVAKIAGVPIEVTERAKEILSGLESRKKEIKIRKEEESFLFAFEDKMIPKSIAEIESRLKSLNVENTTPLEALKILEELKTLVER